MLIDILFLLFAGIGFSIGYKKGIVRAVVTAFSVIVAALAAFRFAPTVTDAVSSIFKSSSSSMVLIGFAVTFIAVILAIRGIVRLIEKSFEAANINFINKIAGGVLSGAIATLVLSGLLWFGDNAGLLKPSVKQESMTYASLQAFPGTVKTFAMKFKEKGQDLIDKGKESLEESKEKMREREAQNNTN